MDTEFAQGIERKDQRSSGHGLTSAILSCWMDMAAFTRTVKGISIYDTLARDENKAVV